MPKFAQIDGWPGYRVGSDGSVWSCWRRGQGKFYLSKEWRKLNQVPLKDGYLGVTLCCGKKRKNVRVHHLVLEAFVGPKPAGAQARHRDDVPTNNRATNLRWGSFQDNVDDRKRRGGYARGEKHHSAKLAVKTVRLIRRLRKTGKGPTAIAGSTGISKHTVENIIYGNAWSHIQ